MATTSGRDFNPRLWDAEAFYLRRLPPCSHAKRRPVPIFLARHADMPLLATRAQRVCSPAATCKALATLLHCCQATVKPLHPH